MAHPSEERELRRQGGKQAERGAGWALLGGRPPEYYERPMYQYRTPYGIYGQSPFYGVPPYFGMGVGPGRGRAAAWLADRIAGAADRLSERLRGGGERMSEVLREGGETLAGVVRERGERLGAGVRERGGQVGEQLRRAARGPRGYRRADDRVLEDVCERIAVSPVDASDVEVQVNDGAVTLTGRVASKLDRRFIEDIADGVFGVTEIRNALRVSRPPEELARAGQGAAGALSGRAGIRCEDLMKREPLSCQEGDSIQTVATKMHASNVGFMPICGPDGRPIGTVTDRDLAIRALAVGKAPQTTAAEVMTREVISCAPSDDLREAEQKMRDRHKSRVMVCDGDGKLVGIISLSDILEHEESGPAAETAREIVQREAHS